MGVYVRALSVSLSLSFFHTHTRARARRGGESESEILGLTAGRIVTLEEGGGGTTCHYGAARGTDGVYWNHRVLRVL